MRIGALRIEESRIYDSDEGVFHYGPGQYIEIFFDTSKGWFYMDSETESNAGPFPSSNAAFDQAKADGFKIYPDNAWPGRDDGAKPGQGV